MGLCSWTLGFSRDLGWEMEIETPFRNLLIVGWFRLNNAEQYC